MARRKQMNDVKDDVENDVEEGKDDVEDAGAEVAEAAEATTAKVEDSLNQFRRNLIAKLERAGSTGHGLSSDQYLLNQAAAHLRDLMGLTPNEPLVGPDHPYAPVVNEKPVGHSLPEPEAAPAPESAAVPDEADSEK